MKRILPILLLLVASVHAYATKVTIDGIVYDVIKKGKYATLVDGNAASGDFVVPEYVNFEGVDCAVTAIGDNAFKYNSKLSAITLPQTVTSIGSWAFNNCKLLTAIDVPENVQCIKSCAFLECRSLTNIVLPDGISKIEYDTFWCCSSLRSVVIPSSVTDIDLRAFFGCTSLTSIEIPKGVTDIRESVFEGCTSLKTVELPDSITTIRTKAFSGCENLEDVYCYATKIPRTSQDCFQNSYIEYATLHVPDSTLEAYRTSKPWSDFGSIVALDEDTIQCSAPVISYENGEITFSSSTEGATYRYTIKDADVTEAGSSTGPVKLNAALAISVYAEAEGYLKSETTTATLHWLNGRLEDSAEINALQADSRPVLVSSRGGTISLRNLNDGEQVSFYSIDGKNLGKAVSNSGEAVFTCPSESVVIAKIGNESIKIKVGK